MIEPAIGCTIALYSRFVETVKEADSLAAFTTDMPCQILNAWNSPQASIFQSYMRKLTTQSSDAFCAFSLSNSLSLDDSLLSSV